MRAFPELIFAYWPPVRGNNRPNIALIYWPPVRGNNRPNIALIYWPPVRGNNRPNIALTYWPPVRGNNRPNIALTYWPPVQGNNRPNIALTYWPPVQGNNTPHSRQASCPTRGWSAPAERTRVWYSFPERSRQNASRWAIYSLTLVASAVATWQRKISAKKQFITFLVWVYKLEVICVTLLLRAEVLWMTMPAWYSMYSKQLVYSAAPLDSTV